MVRLWWNDIQKDICYSPLHITPWYIRSRKMRPNYFHYASTLYFSFSIGLKRTSVVKLWNQTCKSKTAVNPQYTSFNQLLDEYWLTITGSNTTQSNKWRIWQTFWATLNVFNDAHRGSWLSPFLLSVPAQILVVVPPEPDVTSYCSEDLYLMAL